ncbi:DinB family protein [Tellurirhabdus rosea]|uniref:DinB family protein n=1 Tax=Tellurirhabdus rosea TaxID=2674997 RepID=UPI00225BB399|nr:DinB family protein [Tellurirhabdus rosea]
MVRLDDSQVTRLQSQYETVLRLVRQQPEEAVRHQPEPGRWSVHENLAHLGRYSQVFREERLPMILEGKEPMFARYRAEEDAYVPSWTDQNSQKLIDSFIHQRRQLTVQLMGLTEDELSRTGSHPLFGMMNVPEWTEFFLLHEAHHLLTVFRLLRSGK